MENVPPTGPDQKAAARAGRWLAWLGVACVLLATFAAYGQVELLVQWITATFC